jgi:N-acetylglucosaminyl-diphospho-decaprenol L-rhamnosyltransferase
MACAAAMMTLPRARHEAMTMIVQVCLLNYKTPAMTMKALDAVIPEVRALPGSKVVIIDNDSGDGSLAALQAGVASRQLNDIVIVMGSGFNGGYGYGNNAAIRHGLLQPQPPDAFYLLNSDAFVTPNALVRLAAYLDNHLQAGAAGGALQGEDGHIQPALFRFPTLWSELEGTVRLGPLSKLLHDSRIVRDVPNHDVDDVDWVPGASLLIRSSVLQQVGLFDEKFFLYFEETDLCRRIRAAGHRIAFVKDSVVVHLVGATTGTTNLRRRTPGYLLDSYRHYWTKHHGRSGYLAASLVRIVGMASYELRRRIQDKPQRDYDQALRDTIRYTLGHAPNSSDGR